MLSEKMRVIRQSEGYRTVVALIQEEAKRNGFKKGLDTKVVDDKMNQVIKYRRRVKKKFAGLCGGK